MTDARLVVAHTDELGPSRFEELTALCEAAFGRPFAPIWERVGAGIHVVADVAGEAAAHAMVVDRRIYLRHEADLALDAGYVENVATRPDMLGRGHASAVMREIGRVIGEAYAIGALATGRNSFYERLGWITWRGPAWVRMPDGDRVRSSEADGQIMILPTPRSSGSLDVHGPIAVDWRPGAAW